MKWTVLIGMMIVALPVLAGADVIPISDVNEIGIDGFPVLRGSVVTVKGVVVVETGVLAATNDIYIQDETGGVNVLQGGMASPVVARGDSVLVTGYVDAVINNARTTLKVNTDYPETRMVVVNSGNPLPEPLELTPGEISVSGDELEGIYAVVKNVSLDGVWPSCGSPPVDTYTTIADADTSCWLWFDASTDLCGSDEPLETFEVYGIIVPDIQASLREGHGVLAVRRSDVISSGPGSGLVALEPERAYTGETCDLTFDFEAEGGVLTQIFITMPVDWTFSGSSADVHLDGPAFSAATIISTPNDVVLTGCALAEGSAGGVTLTDVTAPDYAGTFAFEIMTADAGHDLAAIASPPEIGVGAQAAAGTVLINEVYAYSGGSDFNDRSEFVELYNPGAETVDLTGWVLTDIDDSGLCGGVNLWEFPEGAAIEPGGYLIVARDARFMVYGQGFYFTFGFYPDFELVDPYSVEQDWDDNVSPDLILITPDDGDDAVSQEIRLLGGPDGSGTIVAGTPSYEAVYLYTDRTRAFLVDAVEYRDPVFLSEDACRETPGLGGVDDAWSPGPPPWHTSLARNATSDDTDVSSADLSLQEPSPGEQNPGSDTMSPTAGSVVGVSHNLVVVGFSEPVDPGDAENRSNYLVGDGVAVLEATLSRDGRTVLLKTTDRVAGESYSIDIDGVHDVTGNPMVSYSDSIEVSATTLPITDVQEYDENGLSVRAGESARVVGFTTVPAGVFQPNYTSMYVQEPDGAGVNVFAFGQMSEPAFEGDLVAATGEVVDYVSSAGAGATTELEASSITVLARGFDPIEPTVMRTGEVGHEDNEGLFVRTSGVVVSVEGFAIYINDGSGAVQVYQNFNDLDFGQFAVGDSVSMTGVILQYDQTLPYLSGYELSPRYDSDMVIYEGGYSGSADIEVSAGVLDATSGEAIEIRYNAPRASHVTVRIYDLKGREVVTLFDGMCLGRQRAVWDGKDNNGRRVPMGAYLCHVLARDRGEGDGTHAAVPIVVGQKLD